MRVNEIFSGMDILKYDYLAAFYKTLVKRFIKGATIEQLRERVENYNQSFLKSKGMYLFYNDLQIKPIVSNWYYICLNGSKFAYNTIANELYEYDFFNDELPTEVKEFKELKYRY